MTLNLIIPILTALGVIIRVIYDIGIDKKQYTILEIFSYIISTSYISYIIYSLSFYKIDDEWYRMNPDLVRGLASIVGFFFVDSINIIKGIYNKVKKVVL